MLPFKIHRLRKAFDSKENMHTLSFVLGAKKLSHGRLDSLLDDLVAAGDPLFLIEITCSSNDGQDTLPLIQCPTRASLIKASLIKLPLEK